MTKTTCYQYFGMPKTTNLYAAECGQHKVARARKAAHLMRDLRLNLSGATLLLDLIEERDALARKLALMDY
jgi:hypothetical protein